MCSPRPGVRDGVTFVEGIEGDHFDFEIAIKGHLAVDILAESGFSSSRSACNSDDNPLDRFLNDTALPDF